MNKGDREDSKKLDESKEGSELFQSVTSSFTGK